MTRPHGAESHAEPFTDPEPAQTRDETGKRAGGALSRARAVAGVTAAVILAAWTIAAPVYLIYAIASRI